MQRAIPSDGPSGAAGLRRTLRRASELSARDWATVLRASAWLLVARAGLRVLGFRRIDALLARGLPRVTRAPDPVRADRLAVLLDIAARHALPPATCLPRSLALRRLLRRERLPAALRIGASREANGALRAHAWVTMDDVVVGDAPDVAERFAVLVPGPEHVAALAMSTGQAPMADPRRSRTQGGHRGWKHVARRSGAGSRRSRSTTRTPR